MTHNNSRDRRIGACSWSLRPANPIELIEGLGGVGVSSVQLALGPLTDGGWDVERTLATLTANRITIRSGMIGTRGEDYTTMDTIRATGGVRSDEHWEHNLAHARTSAAMARSIGVDLVTFHAGFLPEEPASAERATMLDRLRRFADVFAEQGVALAFETGQERADTLLEVLDELDRDTVGVNFDPANMILYDMGDPIDALRALAARVRQIHVKDAVRTETPGRWGTEVPVGSGQVDWNGFFDIVREQNIVCDLMIEREAGARRVAEMRAARELVEQQLTRIGASA